MKKRTLTTLEQFDLRQTLHVATIEALINSRRWKPGDLVFHGGTSLHLVHGSPRLSEDLDFMVGSTVDLAMIGKSVQARLAGAAWVPKGTELTVDKIKDQDKMHSFVVSIAAADLMTPVRVKIEMWRTPDSSLSKIQSKVSPVTLAQGPVAGMQAFVPAADRAEIYADKVLAMGSRAYIKGRDVFDLHWLSAGPARRPLNTEDLQTRFNIYNVGSVKSWVEASQARKAALISSVEQIEKELSRWLPSTWPLDRAAVMKMIDDTVSAMDDGINVANELMGHRASPEPGA